MSNVSDDYEYRGLMAQTWDLFRGDTSQWDDRFFYRDMIGRHGQPALDVGCGTGRLLLDYMSEGIDIDGVEISPEMIALCRDKAQQLGLQPALFQQPMERLDLPRKYRTILVPSSSFQLLLEPDAVRQTIQRFFEHLEPQGALVMPFMLIWKSGDPEQTEWTLTGEKLRPQDGALARKWSRARYDVENRLEHTEDRYEVTLNGEVIASEHHRRSPATRWYTQAEAVALYRAAGFADLHIFREFTHEPASETDTVFTVVGIKPS